MLRISLVSHHLATLLVLDTCPKLPSGVRFTRTPCAMLGHVGNRALDRLEVARALKRALLAIGLERTYYSGQTCGQAL